jgi:hypothetical protein
MVGVGSRSRIASSNGAGTPRLRRPPFNQRVLHDGPKEARTYGWVRDRAVAARLPRGRARGGLRLDIHPAAIETIKMVRFRHAFLKWWIRAIRWLDR